MKAKVLPYDADFEYKIGNKVAYTSGRWGMSPSNPLYSQYGTVGFVTKVVHKATLPYTVRWSNGYTNSYNHQDLCLVHDNILSDDLFTI